MNTIQKHLHLQNGPRQNGKLFCGQMNQNLKLFLETTDILSWGTKEKGASGLLYKIQFKSLHL